jgi:hypothetical protein
MRQAKLCDLIKQSMFFNNKFRPNEIDNAEVSGFLSLRPRNGANQ